MVTSNPFMSKNEFYEAIKNTQTFDDLVETLNRYQGFSDINTFRLLLKKCMHFAGHGFALNEEFPVWQRLFVVADDGGIVFIFVTGLILEFRKERGGKVRMRISTTGGVKEW